MTRNGRTHRFWSPLPTDTDSNDFEVDDFSLADLELNLSDGPLSEVDTAKFTVKSFPELCRFEPVDFLVLDRPRQEQDALPVLTRSPWRFRPAFAEADEQSGSTNARANQGVLSLRLVQGFLVCAKMASAAFAGDGQICAHTSGFDRASWSNSQSSSPSCWSVCTWSDFMVLEDDASFAFQCFRQTPLHDVSRLSNRGLRASGDKGSTRRKWSVHHTLFSLSRNVRFEIIKKWSLGLHIKPYAIQTI